MPDRWSRLQSFFEALLPWFRSSNTRFELRYFGRAPIDRFTREIRLSAAELYKLATLGPDRTDLLLLRMTALNLDPEEVCQTVPETCRVLRRVCAICDHRTACARDFTRNPSGSEWKEYCPNAGTLVILDALSSASIAEL